MAAAAFKEFRYITILVVGDSRVGKTTFIDNFMNSIHEGTDSIETNDMGPYRKLTYCLPPPASNVKINIIELSADYVPGPVVETMLGEVDGVVFCFSVDDRNSLRNVRRRWMREIKDKLSKIMQQFLVGLKSDLRTKLAKELLVEDRTLDVTRHLLDFDESYVECSSLQNPAYAINCFQEFVSKIQMLYPFDFSST